MKHWRTVAGVLLLAALVFFLATLAPAYYRNWQFGSRLNTLLDNAAVASLPDDAIRAQVKETASSLGIPVHADKIRVERDHPGSLAIHAPYAVPVDTGIYTVDLHFRASARK